MVKDVLHATSIEETFLVVACNGGEGEEEVRRQGV